MLFAADAAKTCASQRLSAGDDPHGCSAAVDYALAKVNAVRSELKLQRRKRHILQTRNEKDAKAYLEHMNESKHALLDYIKRSANSEHPDLPTALKEDTETKRRELGRPLSRPTLSPKRRDLKLSLFETSIQKRKKNQKREQTFEEAKRAEASSFSTSSNGRSTSLSQLQPSLTSPSLVSPRLVSPHGRSDWLRRCVQCSTPCRCTCSTLTRTAAPCSGNSPHRRAST